MTWLRTVEEMSRGGSSAGELDGTTPVLLADSPPAGYTRHVQLVAFCYSPATGSTIDVRLIVTLPGPTDVVAIASGPMETPSTSVPITRDRTLILPEGWSLSAVITTAPAANPTFVCSWVDKLVPVGA